MNSKTLAALALLPFGLFASAAQVNESAASQEIVSYGQSQSDSSRQNNRRYTNDDQMRGQPMAQQDERIGLKVGADYLYWDTYFSNMPYAFYSDTAYYNAPGPGGVYVPANGSNLNINMKGESGFRVWTGFFSEWQEMSFDAMWTRFHAKTSNKATTGALTSATQHYPGNENLFGYWNTGRTTANQSNFNAVNHSATGQFTANYDLLDFIFSTKYEPREWARVMPGAGVRALFTKMKLVATQVGNRWGSAIVSGSLQNTNTQRMTQDYDAVGLVGALRGEFDLTDSFRVVSGGAVSAVVGTMKERQFNTVVQAATTGVFNAATDTNVKSEQTQIRPQFDADLGLQYEWMNDEKTFSFLLEAAYEVHYLPNFVQFIRYTNRPTDADDALNRFENRTTTEWSDLFFQGLRIRGGFTF